MKLLSIAFYLLTLSFTLAVPAFGQSVYLHDANISVALAAGSPSEPFANRSTAASLASIIDLPTADSTELHEQSTHVWVSGGSLALLFDLRADYDLGTLHFWNYHSEGFDVDDIDLTFFDSGSSVVGSIQNIVPALGNDTASDFTPIFAEDISLGTQRRVRFVGAELSGSNNQVDFNNLGFTGTLSTVPEPGTFSALVGCCIVASIIRRKNIVRPRAV